MKKPSRDVTAAAAAATFSFDVKWRSDESKECSIEHHRSIVVQWHVHRHQPLYQYTLKLLRNV